MQSVKIQDIAEFTINNNHSKIKEVTYNTFDGLTITIKLYEINNDIYANFSFSSDQKKRKELPDDSPTIVGLPELMPYPEVEKEVKKYSYLENWLYLLNNDFYEDLAYNYSDLIEKK